MSSRYYYDLKNLLDGDASPCCDSCAHQSTRGQRLAKAVRLSLDPSLVLLAMAQAYVMTQAQRKEKDQYLYMAAGSLMNLVLFNLSSIDYDAQ